MALYMIRMFLKRMFPKKKRRLTSNLDLENGTGMAGPAGDQVRTSESANEVIQEAQPLISHNTSEPTIFFMEPPPMFNRSIPGFVTQTQDSDNDDDADTFITADQRSTTSLDTDSFLEHIDCESGSKDLGKDADCTVEQSCSTTTEDLHISSVVPAPREHDKAIWALILEPASRDISMVSRISASLAHNGIANLHREHGFDKCIMYLSVITACLNEERCDEEDVVLEYYGKINERRLQDSDFYYLIVKNSAKILSIKKELSRIMKERTSKNLVCRKCQQNMVDILFLPCGHMIMCEHCYRQKKTVCSCCGTSVAESHHVFF